MTVIVGISCSDGVVIGSDSTMVAGRVTTGYTIERQSDVLKIEVIGDDIITAVTGAMGLAQRFNDQVAVTMKELRGRYQPPQQFVPGFGPVNCTPLQKMLMLLGTVPPNTVPYDVLTPVEIGRIISQATIGDFQRSQSAWQSQPNIGWGLGALFAFVHADKPHLIDFDPVQFHPEMRGQPDPLRGDQDRTWRCVSWGAGQKLADPFLAQAHDLLFGKKTPTVSRAKLVIAWTIAHVSAYNVALVGGGELQLAVLEKINGKWSAHHADPGEAGQQVDLLEKYISEFREQQKPDVAAAQKGVIDLNKELAADKSADEKNS
jgi:Proteasome subunit